MDSKYIPHIFTETLYCFPEDSSALEEAEIISEKTIIVSREGNAAKENELLSKILKSVHIQAEDVLYCTEEEWETLNTQDHCFSNKVLCFGFPSPNELYSIHNEAQNELIYSASLEQLARQVEDKKQLWKVLQKLF